ncbi:MAG: radical SAM protein [Candidatus Zipacnadales bacterium]
MAPDELDFSDFLPEHAQRLATIAHSEPWRSLLADREHLEHLRATMITAPPIPDPSNLLLSALMATNERRVRHMIANGATDVESLVWELGHWPDRWDGPPPPLSFVGIYLTLACNARPRCMYCNQRAVKRSLPISAWRQLVCELIGGNGPRPYFSYTGGEPLMCGEELYGPSGLIRLAAEAGAASNINTNALALTPQVALALVHSGTARLHISLDTASAQLQDRLAGAPGRFELYVRGIYNVQIAREVLGANHPLIHVNCVLTTINLFEYPQLVRFLLERKRVRTPGAEGAWRTDPHYRDLGIHLIPVGGAENDVIRPSAADWERFLTETWAEAASVWDEYQTRVGVPQPERLSYDDYAFFANMYRRVQYKGTLHDYCKAAAQGAQSTLGLGKRCLVAPTQAFFLPDGSQHWCGGHGVSRPQPLGDRETGSIQENIAHALPQLSQYPNEFCTGCPVACLFINQGTEKALRNQVEEWLQSEAKP